MANAHVFISTPALVAVMGFHMFMDITPPSYSLSAVIGSTWLKFLVHHHQLKYITTAAIYVTLRSVQSHIHAQFNIILTTKMILGRQSWRSQNSRPTQSTPTYKVKGFWGG